MAFFVWIATAVLTLHAANSYILLTANLEDVQAIAKQLADSPLSDELGKIWRRAANQFNKQLAKSNGPKPDDQNQNIRPGLRAQDDAALEDNSPSQPEDRRNAQAPNDQEPQDNQEQTKVRNQDENARNEVILSRNTSIYLNTPRTFRK